LLKTSDGYERLFDAQLQIGNVLYVDHLTNFPFFLHNDFKEDPQEIQLYRKILVHWAAAYPWLFYELKNVALKEALMDPKDTNALELFAMHRFKIDPTTSEYITSLLNNQTN
jgi:hypothetical protein